MGSRIPVRKGSGVQYVIDLLSACSCTAPHLPLSPLAVDDACDKHADVCSQFRHRIIESKAAVTESRTPVKKGLGVQYVIDLPTACSSTAQLSLPFPPSMWFVTNMLTFVCNTGTGSLNPRLRDRGRGPQVRGLRKSGMCLIPLTFSSSTAPHSLPSHRRCRSCELHADGVLFLP